MTVIEENWNYHINIKVDREFGSRLCNLRDDVLFLNAFKIQNFNDNGQNHDDELKILIEQNKQLRHDIDTKLEHLTRQRSQYDKFKQDQKLLSQEIKDTHEAFLMAKKFYKKFLRIYYTIESKHGDKQTIFLQFFTEAKKDSEIYSIRLLRDTKTEHYELLETNPKVSMFEELKKKLQETNDTLSVLCTVRETFMRMKKSKKH